MGQHYHWNQGPMYGSEVLLDGKVVTRVRELEAGNPGWVRRLQTDEEDRPIINAAHTEVLEETLHGHVEVRLKGSALAPEDAVAAKERVWAWACKRMDRLEPEHLRTVGAHCGCTPCELYRAVCGMQRQEAPRLGGAYFACQPNEENQ